MGSSSPATRNATAASEGDDHPRGMACVDTSANPRIPILMEMVGALSRATSPQQVLKEFSAGIQQLHGRIQSEGYEHAISHRHETPGHLGRAGAEVGKLCDPPWNVAFPQQFPIEGISSNQFPFRRAMNQRNLSLIQNAEDPPVA